MGRQNRREDKSRSDSLLSLPGTQPPTLKCNGPANLTLLTELPLPEIQISVVILLIEDSPLCLFAVSTPLNNDLRAKVLRGRFLMTRPPKHLNLTSRRSFTVLADFLGLKMIHFESFSNLKRKNLKRGPMIPLEMEMKSHVLAISISASKCSQFMTIVSERLSVTASVVLPLLAWWNICLTGRDSLSRASDA